MPSAAAARPLDLRELAEQRTIARGGANRRRQWTKDYEYVGLKGEEAVSEYLGTPLDLRLSTPGGDGGIDTHVELEVAGERRVFPVQVKCSRKPKNLPVEEGRAIPHAIYILCRYDDATDKAECLGWEWGSVLGKAPVGDIMGYGVLYHHIPRAKTRRMEELRARLPGAKAAEPARKLPVFENDHRCHCGLLGTFGMTRVDGTIEWFCREHRK